MRALHISSALCGQVGFGLLSVARASLNFECIALCQIYAKSL